MLVVPRVSTRSSTACGSPGTSRSGNTGSIACSGRASTATMRPDCCISVRSSLARYRLTRCVLAVPTLSQRVTGPVASRSAGIINVTRSQYVPALKPVTRSRCVAGRKSASRAITASCWRRLLGSCRKRKCSVSSMRATAGSIVTGSACASTLAHIAISANRRRRTCITALGTRSLRYTRVGQPGAETAAEVARRRFEALPEGGGEVGW